MLNASLRTGSVFAATVAIGYTACALVFWAFPQAAATFMTSLFHGLDFSKLQTGTSNFSFGGFSYALVAISAWAFFLGAVFGWLNRLFAPNP